jgi:hypothetical protein
VPVLSLATRTGISRRRSARRMDGASPTRPPGRSLRPTRIRPPRNVPTVSTTAAARKRSPLAVTTPATLSPSRIRSSTEASRIVSPGWCSSIERIARRYSTRSACARVALTAGPLLAFSVRNWMPARSIARAIAPPSASISRVRWPLPIPPIAGLQLICPSVSARWVTSSVRAPARAAASEASVPA